MKLCGSDEFLPTPSTVKLAEPFPKLCEILCHAERGMGGKWIHAPMAKDDCRGDRGCRGGAVFPAEMAAILCGHGGVCVYVCLVVCACVC